MKTTLDISILSVNLAMMAAVGMGLETRHFSPVIRRRRVLPAALVGQMLVLPLIGWFITHVVTFRPHVSAGLLLIAACPVGDIANFYTALARVNTALSVTVNTLSCLLAGVTMAVVFELYGHLAGEPFVFAAPPFQLVIRVLLLTAVPVTAGMVLRRLIPGAVARIAPVIQMACVVGIAAVITLIVVVQAELIAADWRPAAAASFSLMVVAMAAGGLLAILMGLSRAEQITFAVIFSVRNVALASAVAITILGRVEYAAFAVVYFLTEVPLLLGLVVIHRTRQARSELAPSGRLTQ